MVTYDSAGVYITAVSDLQQRVARIDAVIAALEDAALKAAGAGHIGDYFLDDGQTKIKTAYRSPSELAASITAFEKIRQRYINQLNGRVMRLVDGKNFY